MRAKVPPTTLANVSTARVLADDDPLDLEDGPLEGVNLLLETSVVDRCRVGAGRTRGITLRGALPGISSGALRRSTR